MIRGLLLLVTMSAGFLGARSVSGAAAPASNTSTLRTASTRLRHHGWREVAQWLERKPNVRSAAVGLGGRGIDLHFKDGVEAAILSRQIQRVKLPRSTFHLPNRQLSALSDGNQQTQAKALVAEPFETELGLGSSAGTPEVNALKAAGFTVTQLDDAQVTPDTMLTLSSYSVVYMETHSNTITGGGALIATGQPIPSSSKYCDASDAPLTAIPGIICASVAGSNQLYYAVTDLYFQNGLRQFPAHSLVFLNGCNLLSATAFWQILQSKAVGVEISWTQDASSEADYLAAAALFGGMDQGKSVSDAIQAELQAGYGRDQSAGATATIGFLGDGSITFAKALGSGSTASPTPTPTASSTPTATPAPLITATATPGPSPIGSPPIPTPLPTTLEVRVHMKSQALPGKFQDIRVQTNADASVHIRVSFPTGYFRKFSGITDGYGALSFMYPQHAGRIYRHHLFGRVSVTVQSGDLTVTRHVRYRIRFAPLDVSVIPRRVFPGRLVTLWVHARGRTVVAVQLKFPGHSTKLLQMHTGRHGWSYRKVRTPLLEPGPVRLRASAEVDGVERHAYSSFDLK